MGMEERDMEARRIRPRSGQGGSWVYRWIQDWFIFAILCMAVVNPMHEGGGSIRAGMVEGAGCIDSVKGWVGDASNASNASNPSIKHYNQEYYHHTIGPP